LAQRWQVRVVGVQVREQHRVDVSDRVRRKRWHYSDEWPGAPPQQRVGEHPRAADTVGISVYGVRYASVVTSGALAALGGAYLSIGFVHSFNQNMTAGRGFIALAAVIFGNWRPFGAFAAALLFGASTALSFRLAQSWGNASVLFQALPYVLVLIAVAGVIARPTPPASAGRPYVKQ